MTTHIHVSVNWSLWYKPVWWLAKAVCYVWFFKLVWSHV